MKGLVGVSVAITVSAILLLSAASALGIDRTYIESFATARYKDALNTTALWDTLAGELSLFPLPTFAGSCLLPSSAKAVAVWGDFAFVANSSEGLRIIDISDVTHPALVGTYNTTGDARAVVVRHGAAFVAGGPAGLQVIGISNPSSPTLLGTYDTPGTAEGVAVSGEYAYVADRSSGLQIISGISSPSTMHLEGTYDTPGFAYGVAVSGDHAFVADADFGLQVIDISDPALPVLEGTCDTPGSARGIAVEGNHAFIADDSHGLKVVDISDLLHPVIVGSGTTPGAAYGVAVSGNHAFVAGASGLSVFDISDPTNPVLQGSYDTPGSIAYGVAVFGTIAFIADGSGSGLQVIKIGDFVNPMLAGTYDTPGLAYDVAVSGDHAYVADGASGLKVIDISDPNHPTLAGTCNTPGEAIAVAVSGDYAFVADGFSGLQVINISDPTNPTLVGNEDPEGPNFGVTVSGNRAYVTDEHSGLQVIDISVPTHPNLIYTCDTPGWALGVAVSGYFAFVADYDAGLQVIDIREWPWNPTLVGTYDTPGDAYDVTVDGNYAFVADGNSGIQVIDISDPTHPVLVGTYNTTGYAQAVTVSGNYAFVADGESGLHVIQVFQSDVDADDNIGRSLAVDDSDDTIYKARLLATQTGSVSWELSANGGASWQAFASNGSWGDTLHNSGSDLLWRSTHTWTPGVNPTVTGLEIDWLYESASFDSIVDVPNDQGGAALVHFTRSGRDFSDEVTLPIASYGIWRRVDSAALIASLEAQASTTAEKSAAGDTRELGDLPVVAYQGKTYVRSRPDLAAASFPPGTWERLATVPALQEDTYIAAVPTVKDSSESGPNYAVFVMTAHTTTPSIWYVSEPDSGYSVDNIAPAVPEGFAVAYNTGSGNRLTWGPSSDEDFHCFRVYRSSDPDFVPSPTNLVHSTTDTGWSDPEYDRPGVYYKITALDYAGNESAPATSGTVTAVDGPVIPQTYGLYPNAPNPFNPSTLIRYDVPAGGGAVTLRIYDVSGRLIRSLVDGPQTAGQKTAIWNGKDDRGRSMASGVYFYRLEAAGYKKTLKMILVR